MVWSFALLNVLVFFAVFCKKTVENIEGAIKNKQSSKTVNIGYTRVQFRHGSSATLRKV
jgi:hypothetical protein